MRRDSPYFTGFVGEVDTVVVNGCDGVGTPALGIGVRMLVRELVEDDAVAGLHALIIYPVRPFGNSSCLASAMLIHVAAVEILPMR